MLTPEQRKFMIEEIGARHGADVREALYALYESIMAMLIENSELKERIKELEQQLDEAI